MQISFIPAATVGIGFCSISMNSLVISIVCRLTHDLEWLARCGDFNRMHWMLESVPPIPSLYMFGVSLDALVASHGSLKFQGTPFGCYTKAKACENNFHRAADWQLGETMWVASFSRCRQRGIASEMFSPALTCSHLLWAVLSCSHLLSPAHLLSGREEEEGRRSEEQGGELGCHALPSLEAFLAGRIMAAHLLAIDSHFQDSPVADHGIHNQTGPHQNPVFEVLAKAGILSTLRLHLQVVNEFAPFTVKVEENQED